MRVVVAAGFLALIYACSPPQPVESTAAPEDHYRVLATYYPTPEPVVRRMLEAAAPQPGEVHFDLGSGDGRIVLAAARDFGADSTGYEIDPDLIEISRNRIRREGLLDKAKILGQDLLTADLGAADVITAFLTPEAYVELEPILRQKVKEDVRVVAYKFPVPNWKPDDVITMKDPDPTIPEHEIFVYKGRPR